MINLCSLWHRISFNTNLLRLIAGSFNCTANILIQLAVWVYACLILQSNVKGIKLVFWCTACPEKIGRFLLQNNLGLSLSLSPVPPVHMQGSKTNMHKTHIATLAAHPLTNALRMLIHSLHTRWFRFYEIFALKQLFFSPWQVTSYCNSLLDEVQRMETCPKLSVGEREETICWIIWRYAHLFLCCQNIQ